MSPFMNANKETFTGAWGADNNPGTFTLQTGAISKH
jgi:hypothetical protein